MSGTWETWLACCGHDPVLWDLGILNAESRTGDELHDEWRWQRSDMGLAFDQMSGRPIEFSVA